MKKAQAPVFIQWEFLCFYFGRALPNVKLRGFIQSWIFNMRVSERLGSLVFIQKHFIQRTQQLSRGNFSSQVFIYTYNFGCGNLQCSRHKPLNLSKGFYSPGLAVLTLFRCCLQHLSLAFARCVSGFVDSIFEYIGIYLQLFWQSSKQGCVRWNLGGSGFVVCLGMGSGQVCGNAQCNLESCSGKWSGGKRWSPRC
jgi:hypothetical protein